MRRAKTRLIATNSLSRFQRRRCLRQTGTTVTGLQWSGITLQTATNGRVSNMKWEEHMLWGGKE